MPCYELGLNREGGLPGSQRTPGLAGAPGHPGGTEGRVLWAQETEAQGPDLELQDHRHLGNHRRSLLSHRREPRAVSGALLPCPFSTSPAPASGTQSFPPRVCRGSARHLCTVRLPRPEDSESGVGRAPTVSPELNSPPVPLWVPGHVLSGRSRERQGRLAEASARWGRVWKKGLRNPVGTETGPESQPLPPAASGPVHRGTDHAGQGAPDDPWARAAQEDTRQDSRTQGQDCERTHTKSTEGTVQAGSGERRSSQAFLLGILRALSTSPECVCTGTRKAAAASGPWGSPGLALNTPDRSLLTSVQASRDPETGPGWHGLLLGGTRRSSDLDGVGRALGLLGLLGPQELQEQGDGTTAALEGSERHSMEDRAGATGMNPWAAVLRRGRPGGRGTCLWPRMPVKAQPPPWPRPQDVLRWVSSFDSRTLGRSVSRSFQGHSNVRLASGYRSRGAVSGPQGSSDLAPTTGGFMSGLQQERLQLDPGKLTTTPG